MTVRRAAAGLLAISSALVSAEQICDMVCSGYPSINDPKVDNNLCANAWNPEPTGFQCMTVSSTGDSFEADFNWAGGAPFTVHSYPHVELASAKLPIKVSSLTKVEVAVQWGMGPNATFKADAATLGVDTAGLTTTKAMANIAYDLWLDLDQETASNAAKAAWEIMIWLGRFGNPSPISVTYPAKPISSLKVGDYTFDIYSGVNANLQQVYSYVLPETTTDFKLDVVPLVTNLVKQNLIPATAYLGGVHFGSEAFYATETIAFAAKNYTLALNGDSATPTTKAIWSSVSITGPTGQPIGTGTSAASGLARFGGVQLVAGLVAVWGAAYMMF